MRDKRLLQVEELRARYSIHDVARQFGLMLERNGDEWISLCPFHSEKTPSFTVFVGIDGVERFHCFGCGEQGDVLDFVQKIKGVDFPSATSILTGEVARPNVERRDIEARNIYAGIEPLDPPAKIEVGEWINLYNPKRNAWGNFNVEMAFPYFGTDRRLIGYVLRRQLQDGSKETPMVMWVRLPDGKECWSRFPFPKPRTLYNAHLIPSARQVIVVEGEKCADALREQTSRCVVTWPGGVNGLSHADWSPLAGKDVIIWPDADDPGRETANRIAVLLADKAKRVRIVDVSDMSGGWDAADAIDEGWSGKKIIEFLRARMKFPTEPLDGWAIDYPDVHESASLSNEAARSDRPRIIYTADARPAIMKQVCEDLVQRRVEFYARGTVLVRPVILEDRRYSENGRRPGGIPQLIPIDRIYLADRLTEFFDWRKLSKNGELQPIDCPTRVADGILALRGEWPFPQVKAMVTAPTLRPDGTVIAKPGIDDNSGILFKSTEDWPSIPEVVSREHARGALAELKEVLCGFPFKDDADRSAAIALILTAVIRPSLPTAPMFGVSAPTPGTGKSKLIDLVSIIATGEKPAVMAATRDEEEIQKRLSAALIQGSSLITLDNVEHPLQSSFLCEVLTQERVSVRILGESRIVTLPSAVTLCATGNSLRFVGDLTRRVVLINLDAGMERPEERVFEFDILEVVREKRVTLVTAALTVLRGFITHGRPIVVPALGSFEHWSNLVRSAIVWLGEADPLANAERVRDLDPERERTAAILQALPRNQVWTVSDIAKLVEGEAGNRLDISHREPLTDALTDFIDYRDRLDRTGFGNFLRKHRDRVLNGLRIIAKGKNRLNVTQWCVEDVSQLPHIEF